MTRPHGIPVSVRWVTVVTAALVVLVSAAFGLDNLSILQGQALFQLFAFMLAIAVGEVARLSMIGRRESAPVSSASALALSMTVLGPPGSPHIPASAIIVSTAVAMFVGGLAQALRGRPLARPETAARFLAIATVALLYRRAYFDGKTLLQWQIGWQDRRWLVAVVMVLVSSLGLLIALVLEATMKAQHDHSSIPRTIVDVVRDAFGLTTALVTTGALIALAEYALGIVALPLFLLPLLLTQFAVRRYGSIRVAYRQTIGALSGLTDLAGYTRAEHGARVADLSVAMGRDLGMSQRDITELEYAALLHDLGQVALREPIPGGATLLAAPADQIRIANDGAEIVRRTGVLDHVASILESQTTPYRQVREFGQDLPMESRIVKVANAFEDLTEGRRDDQTLARAMERIHLGLGYEYDPRVVDSLTHVLERRRLRGHPLL